MPGDLEASTRRSLETSRGGKSASSNGTPASPSIERTGQAGHQLFLMPDPVALRYLEEDQAAKVLERRRRLEGYEMYLVEQWACSRTHPTFTIATYTGDPSQSIIVGILSVPTDEKAWSSRLKTYFQAVSQYHARKKETPYGTLMVTNLSSFPSALTVISVPDGDIRKHREDLIVNEDLKRMGCSGRAGLNLNPPLPSTQAKYWHLYHVSDKVPFYTSVLELVKLCQLALVIFDKLLPAYADGLLCDVTERALNDWWTDIGTDMFNVEPNDGILGPITVSGLMGLLMGSHNRLKVAGAPIPKDPFDVESMKRAIASFQKQQKIPRTRRLDRQTIDKLHRATAKAASGEGWIVPRAVKSTVAELSGKGGEMVMGMVGARDKASISEIETLDLERISQLVIGSRARWLWQGKPIKQASSDLSKSIDSDEMVFATDDQGGFMWTGQKRDHPWLPGRIRPGTVGYVEPTLSPDQRSGFDRLKDRVGISGTRSQQSHRGQPKDDIAADDEKKLEPRLSDDREYSPLLQQETTQDDVQEDRGMSNVNNDADAGIPESQSIQIPEITIENESPENVVDPAKEGSPSSRSQNEAQSIRQSLRREMRPLLDADRYRTLLPIFKTQQPTSLYLRYSRSAIRLRPVETNAARGNRIPRHLSFSFIEPSILTWEDVSGSAAGEEKSSKIDSSLQMKQHRFRAMEEQEMAKKIMTVEQTTLPWTLAHVDMVDDLEDTCQQQQQEIRGLYHERLDDFLTLKNSTQGIMDDERAALTEGVRRVDVLGQKLDYGLDVLESRIEDVEDGVADFEKSIEQIENRIDSLVTQRPKVGSSSWLAWVKGAFGPRR